MEEWHYPLYILQKKQLNNVDYQFVKEYQPDFIRGYPAFVSDLARYILENGKSIDFKMKGIELTSELVFDHQIDIIKRASNKEFWAYGHAEACVFGYTVDDSFEYYCSPVYGLTEVIYKNEKTCYG